EANEGRGEDDGTASLLLHGRYLCLRGQKGGRQVDREDIVPVARTHVGDRPHLANDTSVVEGGVQLAELPHGKIDESVGIALILHIPRKECGPAVATPDRP